MITYGYAKKYQYNKDGALMIQVRIPSIHGPYKQGDYRGQTIRNYTLDENLPFYHSILLPHTPTDGEVVVLQSLQENSYEFIVIGLTGGSYHSGTQL
jgi:hypothetical protein